jgi:transposase
LDVTDTYYSGSKTDSKARRGKDGKVSKLLQIGLIVTFGNGFPVLHRTYEGNISNIKTFSDLLESMAALGLQSIVMDRGFYSEENVTDLERLGIQVIVGMKQTPGIQTKLLNKIDRDEIYSADNRIGLTGTVVYGQEFPFLKGKLIVLYNPKMEVLKRDKLLEEKVPTKDVQYVGYSLIYHNTKKDIETVVKKYFDKDIVERCFKSLKGELLLHPIRMWATNRVEAHVKICYLSLCILVLIQYKCRKLNLPAAKVLDELQYVYKVDMVHAKSNKKWSKVVTLSNQQKKILKALKCSV